jgi:hypothetical protein
MRRYRLDRVGSSDLPRLHRLGRDGDAGRLRFADPSRGPLRTHLGSQRPGHDDILPSWEPAPWLPEHERHELLCRGSANGYRKGHFLSGTTTSCLLCRVRPDTASTYGLPRPVQR